MSLLIIDKNDPDCCSIDSVEHVKNSLGSPLALPDCLQQKLTKGWASECDSDLLCLFELMTGEKYQQVYRENTYNQQTDLNQFFVFTIFGDIGCNDWCWRRGCFVVVEMGSPGDPRGCHYSPAEIFYLDNDCIDETGFLDWHLGWWLNPVNDRYDSQEIDWLNDRLTPGYSSSPYREMTQNCVSDPVWSDKTNCFLVRPTDSEFPCLAYPVEPHYGG